MDIKPITREEMYLAKAAGQDVSPPEPITRKEMFLAKIAGMEVETPGAITRLEMFANKAAVALNRSVIEPLEITENGTYTAPEGVDGYNPVTVEVVGAGGGSGGGLLPAGVYWEIDKIATPTIYSNRWFAYNDELCAIANATSGSTNTVNVFKLVDGAWSKIVSDQSLYVFAGPTGWDYVNYNGKIHIIGADKKTHYVFDGSAITRINDLPAAIYRYATFVHESKLKAYSWGDGNVYVWDESADTWTIESKIGNAYVNNQFVTVDGVAYYLSGTSLFKYENGTKEFLKALSAAYAPSGLAAYNSCIYYWYNRDWYKYNPTTGVDTFIGRGAYPNNEGAVIYENQLIYTFGAPGTQMYSAIMHDISE